jgi:hypothetical protein
MHMRMLVHDRRSRKGGNAHRDLRCIAGMGCESGMGGRESGQAGRRRLQAGAPASNAARAASGAG